MFIGDLAFAVLKIAVGIEPIAKVWVAFSDSFFSVRPGYALRAPTRAEIVSEANKLFSARLTFFGRFLERSRFGYSEGIFSRTPGRTCLLLHLYTRGDDKGFPTNLALFVSRFKSIVVFFGTLPRAIPLKAETTLR